MTDWAKKLTKKELWKLHHDVITKNTKKKADIDKLYNKTTKETECECIFNELWGTGEEASYVPTSYTFKAFEYEDHDTSGGDWKDQKKYRTWIAKHFGKKYIAELLEKETGIPRKETLKIMKGKKKKKKRKGK